MFKVLEGRKRRAMSPATMAASVAAHLLLLGGAVYAAANDTRPVGPPQPDTAIVFIPLEPKPLAPPVVEPTPPPMAEQPRQPDARELVAGARVDLRTPTEVPDTIIDERPGTPPVDSTAYGDGITGDTLGTPPAVPTPPTGNVDPVPAKPDVPRVEDVEEGPVLNRSGLERTMERFYPSVLRDSRVAGRVVVELIVDENGQVREGSARIIDASHPAFGEAALRAVERFRFHPAKMAGVPVPVIVTVPITWTVPQ